MSFSATLLSEVTRWLDTSSRRPLLIGISAPQGAGKTTLTKSLCELAKGRGLHAVSVSIDDFYLTRAEQVALAEANPGNPYLQQRGYPGTHDLQLGLQTLRALEDIHEHGSAVIPVYDKSAHRGQGDRKPRKDWVTVDPPLDLVFVEGWMLGFTPEGGIADPHLRAIDERLAGYEPWHAKLGAFIWLEPREPEYALEWRVEAEERMKASGKPGMSTEEVRAYIEKFMPAYRTYLPGLLRKGPPVKGPHLHYVIGRDRQPTSR